MADRTIPVGLVTLGCAKNAVDSEYMLAELTGAGFALTEDLSAAEAIVINTCAFIRPAKEESIETVLEAARYKEQGRCRVLAVVGCMAQRYAGELKREMPEVDIFLGVGDQQRRLGELLKEALHYKPDAPVRDIAAPRAVETAGQGWAYLKISEGCDNRCSYCAIPLIRGGLASRPEEEIIKEAQWLESLGIRELNLIAQDVTAYGADRTGRRPRLRELLERLLAETGIPWLRLLYAHPAHLDRGLLELLAANSRILPYLDLPVQHAADKLLERMGRGITKQGIIEKISLARAILGEPTLRTTVLVGFPGETGRDFEELLEFIEAVRFDHLGGFIYSAEEDTRAAGWRDRLSRAEKERRLEAVLELQRTISAELNLRLVGRSLEVLIEREVDPREAPGTEYRWAGRSSAQAPEVDGAVYVEAPPGVRLSPGRLARVRITESGDYDLFGTLLTD